MAVLIGTQPRAISRKRKSHVSVGRTTLAAVVSALFIGPVLWIVIGSFRPSAEMFDGFSPLSFRIFVPRTLTLENYRNLFADGFGQAIMNSLLVAVISVIVGLILTSSAAYALAVLRFPGKNLAFVVIVVSFMIPFEAIAIPLYQVFSSWNLSNSFFGLILPGIANGLAVFNLRQAFLGLPSSLREAARIDGASEFRIYRSIYIPLGRPALINSGILLFLAQWSAYLWPLILITDQSLQVAPVNLAFAFSQHAFDFGKSFAGTVILAFVPALILISLRRFFIVTSASAGEK